MSDRLPPEIDNILKHMELHGGRITFATHTVDRKQGWLVGYEFGREAEDSDMAGGAAYGTGPDLDSAVAEVAEQIGIEVNR